MDSFLLTKALNYHGQELLRAIEEKQGMEQLRCVDLRSLDYHEYHKRAKEFGFKERQKRQKLFRFIGKKACSLYTPPDLNPFPVTWDADNEDLCAVMPPLETFMSVPGVERRRHFMESLQKQDLVVGQITRKHEPGLNIQLLCLDGGKRREIYDLGIKVSCHKNHIACVKAPVKPMDEFQVKDYIRGMVIEVLPKTEKIKIVMRPQLVAADLQYLGVKMGVITEEEIPSHHKNYLIHQGRTYDQVLERTLGFYNPATVSHMSELVGLPRNKITSFMTVLNREKYSKDDYAVELRKTQSAKWAYKSVRDGVSFFKAGNQVEAFQCLNKALQIHPENVEALVARGALFANNSNLRRALEDFERALEIDPNHVNGKKYVSETLVALGRYYEDKGDMEEATKTYKRAIQSNPDNANAKDALLALETREQRKKLMAAAKEQIVPTPPPPRTQEPSASRSYDTREKLKILLKEEKRVPDHGRTSKRSWSSPEEEIPVVRQKPVRETSRQEEAKKPPGYGKTRQRRQQHSRSRERESRTIGLMLFPFTFALSRVLFAGECGTSKKDEHSVKKAM